MTVKARERLIAEVQQTKNNFWSAYDRGRLAAIDGHSISENPFRNVAPNITFFDWEQGWLDEHVASEEEWKTEQRL